MTTSVVEKSVSVAVAYTVVPEGDTGIIVMPANPLEAAVEALDVVGVVIIDGRPLTEPIELEDGGA